MTTLSFPLVGPKFRPPALALLSVLPAQHPLLLIPEPTSQFDPNAIQVILETSTLRREWDEELGSLLPGYGIELEAIFAEEKWHLGYIARDFAINLAPLLKGETYPAQLGFNAEGKHRVLLDSEAQPLAICGTCGGDLDA